MHSRRVSQHLFPVPTLFHYPGLKKDEIGYQDNVNVTNQFCTLWRLARNYLCVVISLATLSGWKGWKERERDKIAGYVPCHRRVGAGIQWRELALLVMFPCHCCVGAGIQWRELALLVMFPCHCCVGAGLQWRELALLVMSPCHCCVGAGLQWREWRARDGHL